MKLSTWPTPAICVTVVCLAALPSCGKSEAAKLIDQYGESAQATIATLESLADEQAPSVDGSDAWRNIDLDLDKALVFFRSGLEDLNTDPGLENPYESPFGLGSMIEFVRTEEIDEAWLERERSYVVEALESLADPSAIIVIEPVEVIPGEVVDPMTYRAGHFAGEAHFYDASGEHQGGFAFSASNPSQLEFPTEGFVLTNAQATLDGNLYRCAWESFRRELAAAFPDAGIIVPDICDRLDE